MVTKFLLTKKKSHGVCQFKNFARLFSTSYVFIYIMYIIIRSFVLIVENSLFFTLDYHQVYSIFHTIYFRQTSSTQNILGVFWNN